MVAENRGLVTWRSDLGADDLVEAVGAGCGACGLGLGLVAAQARMEQATGGCVVSIEIARELAANGGCELTFQADP